MSHSPTKRRHDLDALRAIAMMLGIVLHAAIAYTGFGWAVSDPSHSRAFIYLFDAVHGFRMQLFFFISGYFTTMLYFKRGMRGLLYQRGKRILIPLLLFAPLLSPLTQWIINQAKGESQATLFPETLPFWQSFNLHHLWFLWFLVLFVIFFACWNWLKIPQKLAFFSKNYSGAPLFSGTQHHSAVLYDDGLPSVWAMLIANTSSWPYCIYLLCYLLRRRSLLVLKI